MTSAIGAGIATVTRMTQCPALLIQVPASSTRPPNHILLTIKFDTLDDLMDVLNDFCASTRFSVIKQRSSNYIKGFGGGGESRVDVRWARGKIRNQEAHSRLTSTAKVNFTLRIGNLRRPSRRKRPRRRRWRLLRHRLGSRRGEAPSEHTVASQELGVWAWIGSDFRPLRA